MTQMSKRITISLSNLSMSHRAAHIRGAVVSLLRAGHETGAISVIIDVSKSTVSTIKKRFTDFVEAGNYPDDFDVQHAAGIARTSPSDLCTEEQIVQISTKIDENPGKLMRCIVKEMDISSSTVNKVVHEDLNKKSYALKRGQMISEVTRAARVQRGSTILRELKKPASRGGEASKLVFFSDEKNFFQDRVVNRHDDRWICAESSELPVVMRAKYPSHLMMLGVVSNEEDVMAPHIFESGFRLSAQDYLDVMCTDILLWIKCVAGGRPYTFQQDGAPAHTAKVTQDWCKANFHACWDNEPRPPALQI